MDYWTLVDLWFYSLKFKLGNYSQKLGGNQQTKRRRCRGEVKEVNYCLDSPDEQDPENVEEMQKVMWQKCCQKTLITSW